MKNRAAKFGALLLLGLIGREGVGALPSEYGAVPFEEALASAQKDGRAILVYFGEDW
jgi:hypothetical protein